MPSSVNTFVFAPIENRAVVALAPFTLTWFAKPAPSEEPSESRQMKLPRSMSPSFTGAVHMTPEETIIVRLDRS